MKTISYMMLVIFFTSLLIIGFIPDSLGAEGLSGQDIMKKNKVQKSCKDEEVTITLTLINKRGKKRIRKVKYIKKTDVNDMKKSLIIFESPADVKGTKLLTIEHANKEDDQWFYLPALKRVRRISANENGDSFMGSEFFFEDIRSEHLDDYQYNLLRTEIFDGIECYVIEALPITVKKKKQSVYSKREFWIRKANFVNIQIKFYDRKGKLLKIFHGSDVTLYRDTNKLRIHKLDMYNIQINHKTKALYKHYKINQELPDRLFTQQYLYRDSLLH